MRADDGADESGDLDHIINVQQNQNNEVKEATKTPLKKKKVK